MNHPSKAAVIAGCQCDKCHPSEAAYVAGCKCDPCMRRRMRVRKLHHVRVAQGAVMVSDEDLVQKLNDLVGEGYGPTMIAHAAGMSDAVIVGIRNGGRTDRARRARLLRVTRNDILTRAPDNAHVPPIGAQRRIQALMRIGWSQVHLADGNETRLRLLSDIACGKRKYIRAVSHREIAAMYRRLCMTPGPSDTSRLRAEKRGYAPPLAWDDAIDDPNARPDTTGMPQVSRDHPRHQQILALHGQGLSDRKIAAAIGVTGDAVRYWRMRIGLTPNTPGRSTALGDEPDDRYRLWQDGHSDQQIADKTGKHPDLIRKWRRRHGLEAAGRWPAA